MRAGIVAAVGSLFFAAAARADGPCSGCEAQPPNFSCGGTCGWMIEAQNERIFVGCHSTDGGDAQIHFAVSSTRAGERTICIAGGDAGGSSLGQGVEARSLRWPGAHLSWSWMSGCGVGGGDKVIALIPATRSWELIWDQTHDSPRSQCENDEDRTSRVAQEKIELQEAVRVKRVHAEGLRAFKNKNFPRAEERWRSILDQSIDARNDLGFLLAESGRVEEAERTLLGVIARSPQRAVAWLNLADLEWSQGRKNLARIAYREYAALKKKAPARVKQRLLP